MNRRLVKSFSLFLAGALQIMPLVRSALPTLSQGLAPSAWAIVFRWAAGGLAMFGYHAVSSASSIALSPANATVGQPYVGTVTYSGGHAGSVSSMSLSNVCLGSATPLFAGLTIVYAGGNTATVTGTPSATNTYSFTLRMYDGSGCGGGNSDMRTTSLVVGPNSATGIPPAITSPPQGVTAQIGAGALLSAGASGTPPPVYYWFRGLTNVAANLVGAGSALDFPSVQLANSGLYTVVASNASGQASAPAFLSVALTPGTNQLALNYTNYYTQGHALTMYSYFTNVPTGSNVYKWQYNTVDITPYSTNGNNLNLTAAQVVAAKSGTYSVVFSSVVGATTVVPQQAYYSYWAFGLPPVITGAPQGTNVNVGNRVTLTATATNVSVPPSSATLPYYGTNTLLHFQWFRDGTLLASQVTNGLVASESLTLNPAGAGDQGNYTVVVSNVWGSITSNPVAVTVGSSAAGPTITAQPSGMAVLAGQNATFRVTASGTPPLSYQWQRNSSNLSDGGAFSGANTNVLRITGVGTNLAGSYSVVITNLSGTTNSDSAPLVVALPPSFSVNPGAGGLQLSASTVTGINYIVQSTTNLTSGWTSLATNSVPSNGLLSFTNSTANPEQFFRLLFP